MKDKLLNLIDDLKDEVMGDEIYLTQDDLTSDIYQEIKLTIELKLAFIKQLERII